MTNYYIDPTNGQDTNSGLSSSAAFLTIAKAINVIVDNDNIILMAGSHNYDIPSISKTNITIHGLDKSSCVINLVASNNYISSDANTTLTIKNCTINAGGSNASVNSLGSIKVFDCIFQKNKSTTSYGIINSNNCVVIDCTFQEFTTCIFNATSGKLTVIGCVFNSAGSAAISNDTNGMCKIHNNTYIGTNSTLTNCVETDLEKIEKTEYEVKQFYRKMLTNLLVKGVEVTGDEKLTTLTNKILWIKLSSKLTVAYVNNILTATLVDINNKPIDNVTIKIVDVDQNVVDSGITNSSGVFQKTYTGSTSVSVHAVYEGSNSYYPSNSGSYITITK